MLAVYPDPNVRSISSTPTFDTKKHIPYYKVNGIYYKVYNQTTDFHAQQ